VATLRARLTVTYGFALVGGLIVFAAALYSVRAASDIQELGPVALAQGDRALTILRAAALGGDTLTVERPLGDASGKTVIYASDAMRSLMERVPGYFIVYDRDNRQIYSSIGIRQLHEEDRSAIDETAVRLLPNGRGALVSVTDSLFNGKLLLAARRDPALLPEITRVVAGVPTTMAELSAGVLLGTMLVVLPVFLIASVAASYFIAGSALEPIEQLINEVEAITDGRSLHRRLPADLGNDELSRLGNTLNAMIARLETSFGALRRFTADASHELKTPLTVLRADVERAMHPSAQGSEAMQALEEALQETARMSDLVDSLLTLARADEGRFDLHREPVALGPLVRDVFETATILGEDAGLTVSLSVLEEGVIDGDARRLRQLFLNLVTNAIKYTPSGGRVELSLSQRLGDEIAFTVRDSGIGMSAADLSHVFERFWRADRARSRTSERGGFGLGLAISQWIAQAHGGRIAVQSRLGRGSVFTVTLPLISPAAHAAADQLRRELAEAREARDVRDAREGQRAKGGVDSRPLDGERRNAELRDIGD
jgi:two-component system, OmpR family, sensor kinase